MYFGIYFDAILVQVLDSIFMPLLGCMVQFCPFTVIFDVDVSIIFDQRMDNVSLPLSAAKSSDRSLDEALLFSSSITITARHPSIPHDLFDGLVLLEPGARAGRLFHVLRGGIPRLVLRLLHAKLRVQLRAQRDLLLEQG